MISACRVFITLMSSAVALATDSCELFTNRLCFFFIFRQMGINEERSLNDLFGAAINANGNRYRPESVQREQEEV